MFYRNTARQLLLVLVTFLVRPTQGLHFGRTSLQSRMASLLQGRQKASLSEDEIANMISVMQAADNYTLLQAHMTSLLQGGENASLSEHDIAAIQDWSKLGPELQGMLESTQAAIAWAMTGIQSTRLVSMISELFMKQRIKRLHLNVPECDAWKSCKSKCSTDVSTAYGGTQDLHFRMVVLHNDNYISRTPLCEGKVWEDGTVNTLLGYFKNVNKGNFLDVGANLGSFSLPLAAFMKKRGEGKVLAVEANPDAVSILQQSITENNFDKVVTPHTVALVQDASEAPELCNLLSDTLKSSNPGGNQVDLGNRHFDDCKKKVKTTTLDMIYKEQPHIMSRLVAAKLDCEGCEGQALLGARQLLSEHPPCYLAFEITEKYLCEAGTSLSEIYKLLEETGYDTEKHPGPPPHGDGSCEGFGEWTAEDQSHNAFVQSFHIIPQKDIDSCLSRFVDVSYD